uniref:Uncharacterized protein n=1 Tax=Strigamia maritima TaxID=126957 RepID=T1JME8_STRMM
KGFGHVIHLDSSGIISLSTQFIWKDSLLDLSWSEAQPELLITSAGDGTIQLWNIQQPHNAIRVYGGHLKEVYSVQWNQTRTGDNFISSSWDQTVKLWNVHRLNFVQSFDNHHHYVYESVWSPQIRDTFASVSGDGYLRLWNILSKQPTQVIRAHDAEILSCDWNKYNQYLIATAASDGLIRCWDIRNTTLPTIELPGHKYAVRRILFSPHYENVLVSTSYDFSTRDLLRKGGSAVDAAIATLLCMGVFHPQSMGLGGGCLINVYDHKRRKANVIDAREVAPSAAHESVYIANSHRTLSGGLAVAVPGELRGYWEAHTRYGILPWSDLVEPAIKMCREGITISRHLGDTLQAMRTRIELEPTLKEVFINRRTGEVYKHGETIIQADLAKTLQAIAHGGADALYTGKLAQHLIEDIRHFGGNMTLDDLKNYRAVFREAVRCEFRDGTVLHSTPPPGSGSVLAHILQVMDGFKITDECMASTKDAAIFAHRFAETLKFAFAQRSQLGDPAFVEIDEVVSKLMSKGYARAIRDKIRPDNVQSFSAYGLVLSNPDDSGTAHLSVLAPNGDAVAVTSSVNTWLGAGIRSRSTGIVLNNEMDDFSFPSITNHFGVPPSPTNFMRAGKRPQSSMCPSIFTNSKGDVVLVIGAAGGTKILSSISQAVIRTLWIGDTIKEAIDARRLHHQLLPNEIQLEEGFPEAISRKLRRMGHRAVVHAAKGSSVVAIHKHPDGSIHACADFRKDGSTAGY